MPPTPACYPTSQKATLNRPFFIGGEMFRNILKATAFITIAATLAVCTALAQTAPQPHSAIAKTVPTEGAPTLAEAQAFMKHAEAQLADLSVRASRASWVQENFITDDTEVLSAQAQEKLTAVVTQLALDTRRFDGLKMPPELGRKFGLLKLSRTAPAPNNDPGAKELPQVAPSMHAG